MTLRSPVDDIRILLVAGSSRAGSTNAAVLRTGAALAPPGVATESFERLGELPLFNPDDDVEGAAVDPRVAEMRAAVHRADALLICTPEYAGALPAALKNLLEWTIGDAGTYQKPVGAADAHASLRKVLGYAGAEIVEAACARVPITRQQVGADGLIADDAARREIAQVVARLADHLADPLRDDAPDSPAAA